MPAQCVSNDTNPGDIKYAILHNKEKQKRFSF